METNKILHADLLDLLFEGRNKEYGAYDLRKTYNRRLVKSLGGVGLLIALLLLGYSLSALKSTDKKFLPVSGDVFLEQAKEVKKPDPIIPLPQKAAKPPEIKIKQFTPPLITRDEIKPDEVPPVQDDLTEVKIGAVNRDGLKDDGDDVIDRPVTNGTGLLEAPTNNIEDDVVFGKVEIESEYPGGSSAWLRYLNRNLRYPEDAVSNGLQGRVYVRFIVDKEGNVSDIEAISGPTEGGLREEAIRVIKKSGKWTPAVQNGHLVKSYKSQPVVFQLAPGE